MQDTGNGAINPSFATKHAGSFAAVVWSRPLPARSFARLNNPPLRALLLNVLQIRVQLINEWPILAKGCKNKSLFGKRVQFMHSAVATLHNVVDTPHEETAKYHWHSFEGPVVIGKSRARAGI